MSNCLKYYQLKKVSMVLLLVYSLYALTNILLVPNSRIALKNSKQTEVDLTKQPSKLHGEKVIFQLMDRSIVSKNDFECKPVFFLLLIAFSALLVTGIVQANVPPLSYLFNNKQYSYLIFHILLI